MMRYDAVLRDVTAVVADVLGFDVEEVKPHSRFFEDLNGESIEILETAWKLDKLYGRSISLQNVVPSERLEVDENGRLTASSLAKLRADLPFLNVDAIAADPRTDRLSELVTVDAIARVVMQQIGDDVVPTPNESPDVARA